jgi:hypothetical protein
MIELKMKKYSFINRSIERIAIKKALQSLEEELVSMDNLQEKNYINVMNSGFLIDTTAVKRRVLYAGIALLKSRLKK